MAIEVGFRNITLTSLVERLLDIYLLQTRQMAAPAWHHGQTWTKTREPYQSNGREVLALLYWYPEKKHTKDKIHIHRISESHIKAIVQRHWHVPILVSCKQHIKDKIHIYRRCENHTNAMIETLAWICVQLNSIYRR